MPYTSNPYAPKARRLAVNLVRVKGMKPAQVARMYGVHRATVGKWLKRASQDHREFVPTQLPRPKHHPNQLPDATVERIVELRNTLKRCAPVIHAHMKNEGIQVSLSSVERTLRRRNLTRKKKQASFYTPLPRPHADKPGDLVQVDTIHFVRGDNTRFYVYAVIDTYSRLAYAQYSPRLMQTVSHTVILNAQKQFGFTFSMIQTDNGPEFKDGLQASLGRKRIKLRHSRVRTPNDNAHVERFNRTIQEECFRGKLPNEATITRQLKAYVNYYNHDRLHLGINLLTPAQFVAKLLT